MLTRKAGLMIAAAVVAAAFSTAAGAQSEAARSETVLGFRATGDTLQVRVSSGGCTTANDFTVNVDRSGGQAQVTLVRIVPDNCKGDFPEGTEIAISREAAGVEHAERVQLMNRVATPR
jgi:hypothetical protein